MLCASRSSFQNPPRSNGCRGAPIVLQTLCGVKSVCDRTTVGRDLRLQWYESERTINRWKNEVGHRVLDVTARRLALWLLVLCRSGAMLGLSVLATIWTNRQSTEHEFTSRVVIRITMDVGICEASQDDGA
jgi:hypothetical protein